MLETPYLEKKNSKLLVIGKKFEYVTLFLVC